MHLNPFIRWLRSTHTMPETVCKKCGSDLREGDQICSLCNQILRMHCSNCDFISDTKFHVDCANAELFLR